MLRSPFELPDIADAPWALMIKVSLILELDSFFFETVLFLTTMRILVLLEVRLLPIETFPQFIPDQLGFIDYLALSPSGPSSSSSCSRGNLLSSSLFYSSITLLSIFGSNCYICWLEEFCLYGIKLCDSLYGMSLV